ncbi:MAG: amino acid adenylation domain-containing protein, partial [bacterium]|nr:amino acid adenylation domain-containing protein [bacterium]
NHVTTMHFVPSMLNVFLEYLEGGADTRKLRSLRQVFASGEALSVRHVERFSRLLYESNNTRLINLYGPTEATVDVSYYNCWEDDRRHIIPIGKPIDNIQLHVVDKGLRIQGIGIAGELCIAGVGLARGYLNRPRLTAEKFPPAGGASLSTPLYRTGDLARWLPDGNIEFLGRIDHQVKIRGFRIELGEIENQLLRYAAVKEAVVIARNDGTGDTYICAYFVPHSPHLPDSTELREFLSQSLPDYMIPPYFVQLERVPLTPNGKVDRRSLPEPEAGAGDDYTAPRDELETKLVEIWSGVLGVEKEKIGIHHNFFELGGHSLKGTRVIAGIHREFDVKIKLADMFKMPYIESLSAYIKGAAQDKFVSIPAAEEKEYYPLSSAQNRLYFLQYLVRDGVNYNIPNAVVIEGNINREKLETVFIQLINRHKSLRTSFFVLAGEPVQKIHKHVDFKIHYYDPDRNGPLSLISDFVRPFDLARPPLLRAGLKPLEAEKHILMIDMHHIITDGTSHSVLEKEFMSLYAGEAPAPLRVQYTDYVLWQKSEEEKTKDQEAYWLQEFSGEVPVLTLPTDHSRPALQSFEGNSISFNTRLPETTVLKEIIAGAETTSFVLLLSLFNLFLAKLSGMEDIVIGTPVAGRRHPDLQDIIGMFVNTLPLRNNPRGDKRFDHFLSEVKERTLKAFENQEYQYEDLVGKVSVNRDTSRNPLFDVLFLFKNIDYDELNIPGLTAKPYEYESNTSKFDLTLAASDEDDGLHFTFEYCTKLFNRDSVERFARSFDQLIRSVVEIGRCSDFDVKLSDIELVTPGEKQQILYGFNDTEAPYPGDKTLHSLFEEQAARTPGRIAVVDYRSYMTYSRLNQTVTHSAHRLVERGAASGDIVGIMMERSIEMIVGIYGILKAGAAYLPINPHYPQERIDFMLKDSNAKILLTKESDIFRPGPRTPHPVTRNRGFQPAASLSYVIYTSGSTGRPKGVLIERRPLINRLNWMQKAYPIGEQDVLLQKTTITFDVSVWELFWWSIVGASVCLLEPGGEKSPGIMIETIERNHVTTMHFVPSMLNVFLEYIEGGADTRKLRSLRRVFASGEALSAHHVERFSRLLYESNNSRLINLYGPTEATVDVSYYNCWGAGPRHIIPIGKPIDNIRLYVVDKGLRLQGIGIAGELCIAGAGLARGYLNRPELTAEKFCRGAAPSLSTPLYRTGDLARWLPDGNIEFLGRIDHQVKIRGFRIELGEIEAQLLKHPSIGEAVVIDREDTQGEKFLIAYIVGAFIETPQLKKYLSQTLPGYMIPSYFHKLDEIPVTQSGKVNRKALLRIETGGIVTGAVYEPPFTEVQKKLVEIWQEVLNVPQVGITDNFFALGGHSLKAILIVSRIHRRFKKEIPLSQIFDSPTVEGLASFIGRAGENPYASIQPVEQKEHYPVSSAQNRLFVLQQMAPDSIVYNIPQVMTFLEEPDIPVMEAAFRELIQRHESLRTSFHIIDGRPVQRIHRRVEFTISSLPHIAGFFRPFDLSAAPLVRAGIIKAETGTHILLVDIHHIISDAYSQQVLTEDFQRFYNGEELPSLRLQYKDFSQWQGGWQETSFARRQETWWLKELGGELPVLNMPTDFPRPAVFSFAGGSIGFEIGTGETRALKNLARSESVTLFILLLALYNVLLSRLCGQEDIIVGTPVVGRRHTDLERIIGMFVNTIALRNYPVPGKAFGAFLADVRRRSLDAFENQEYPFDDLVEKVRLEKDISRNPVFDAAFSFFDTAGETGTPAGPPPDPGRYRYENLTTKFDMTLYSLVFGDSISCTIEYGTSLFKEETIRRFTRYFRQVVSTVCASPHLRISEIDIVPEEEKAWILSQLTDTAAGFPGDRTIHRIFEDQVEKTPHGTALVHMTDRSYMTYAQLDKTSNRSARQLREKGVGPDTITAMVMDRAPGMIVGILGILKAGGAYLPIDPEYPQDRIDYMLKDSNAKIVLNPGADSQSESPLERALEGPRRGTPKGGGVSNLA